MDGFLLINKPRGLTSHDVCQKLRKITKEKRVGHTGTLDPMAEGLLVVLLGKATKLAEYIVTDEKEYIAEITFGLTTDTQDIWGKILNRQAPDFGQERFQKILNDFLGESFQIPPMYSALKQNGRHLYEFARNGEDVERPARKIEIRRLDAIEMEQLPSKAMLAVGCSKGTYIRTLCYDIGETLGCGAVMSALQRTRIGSFSLCDAYTLDEISAFEEEGRLQEIVRLPDELLIGMKHVDVKPESARIVLNGNLLEQRNMMQSILDLKEGERLRIYLNDRFVGVGHACAGGTVQPEKIFSQIGPKGEQ